MRGGKRASNPAHRVGGQLRGAFQECGGRGEATACLGAARGTLEICGDTFVRADCCLRAVPRAAFRIGLGVSGFGEGAVGAAPFFRRGSAVDRRAHQRMPKRHSLTELDQPRAGGRRSDVDADSELVRGPPHQHRITDRFRRGNQQQSPRLGLQCCQLPLEHLLDTVRERCRTWRTKSARQFRRRQPSRQFEQRQRVAPCLGHQSVDHPRIDGPAMSRDKQRARIFVRQTGDDELGQTGQLLPVARVPHRQDHRDGFRPQSPRDECQCLRRGAVQPLCVVDETDQRPLARDLAQQAERGQPDHQAIWSTSRAQPKRRAQRIALRTGQVVQPVKQGRA